MNKSELRYGTEDNHSTMHIKISKIYGSEQTVFSCKMLCSTDKQQRTIWRWESVQLSVAANSRTAAQQCRCNYDIKISNVSCRNRIGFSRNVFKTLSAWIISGGKKQSVYQRKSVSLSAASKITALFTSLKATRGTLSLHTCGLVCGETQRHKSSRQKANEQNYNDK